MSLSLYGIMTMINLVVLCSFHCLSHHDSCIQQLFQHPGQKTLTYFWFDVYDTIWGHYNTLSKQAE